MNKCEQKYPALFSTFLASYHECAKVCKLRAMTTEDLTDVVAIEQDCHSKPWGRELFQRELDNPLAHVILCVVDESIAGYICFWDIAAEVEIHNVATTPSLRGMGVGRVLMDCVFSYIDSCKIDSAFLEVRSSNAIAIRLYEKFAFLTVDRRTNYYSDGEDALLMQWRRQSS